MKFGHLQRECHKLLLEVFESRTEAYTWLYKEFKVKHFADLKTPRDDELIEKIYEALYIKSITEPIDIEPFVQEIINNKNYLCKK